MPDDRPTPTYFGAPPRALAASASAGARAVARVRMLAGFAARTAGAWLSAGRRLVHLRLERRRLDAKRRELQYELGGAALAQDEPLVESLRAGLHACLAELTRNETAMHVTIDRARDATSEERSAVAATEIRPPDASSMGDPGFEPGTSALSERRSNQLS